MDVSTASIYPLKTMYIANWLTIINQNLVVFLLIMTRFSTTLASMIIFRREWVPTKIILFFSMVMGVFILTIKPTLHQNVPEDPLVLFLPLVMQITLGIITAFVINLFIEIFLMVGQIVSMQSGLGFANLVMPRLGNITPVSNFLLITIICLFFQLNGHLILIKLISDTFTPQLLFIQQLDVQALFEILLFVKIIFKSALMIALSVIITLYLSNITIAIMTKFAPQLNIFTIGINISIILCLLGLYLAFDFMLENGEILLNHFFDFLRQLKIEFLNGAP